MTERGPDLPVPPRQRRSVAVLIYAVLGAAVLAGWMTSNAFGWPLGAARSVRDTVPVGARSSPGGYRAYHFWHAGYRGGK